MERLELIGPWFWSKKQRKFVDWKTICEEEREDGKEPKETSKVYKDQTVS